MKKVIVIGTFVADILLKGYDLSRVQLDNIAFLGSCGINVGGNACNVAMDLRKLGVGVQVMGRVAGDEFGNYILNEMKGIGIDCSCMQYDETVNTGVSVVFIEKNGEKAILQYVGANNALAFDEMGIDKDVDAAIITGLGLIPEIEDSLFEITEFFTNRKIPVIIDTSANTSNLLAKMDSKVLRNIDYMIINEREVLDLTKADSISCAAEMLRNRGCRNLIVKVGERGAYFWGEGKTFLKEGIKTTVVDTTGAGDAFLSGFTYALLDGADVEECVEFANMLGSCCVEKMGSTNNIIKETYRNFIRWSLPNRATNTIR